MILRRITEHVKAQNWFAVAIDFVIVVVGVFIGLQVNTWSEARAAAVHERSLLRELRAEMDAAIADMTALKAYLGGVAAAGERSLGFLKRDEPCRDECWGVVVDFFHASQWTDVAVRRATYDEMRREGLPRSQAVFEAAEAFYAQNDSIASVMNERPVYRNLVRELIPVEAQRVLWLECHAVDGGAERLRRECARALPEEAARSVADGIKANAAIAPALTHWTSLAAIAPPYIDGEVALAERVVAAIDAELGDSPK